ncbi:hypothetical protein GN956_G26794, partial [Arapaima gigas]
VESERALQRRLEEVSEELRRTQNSSSSLQADLEKTRKEAAVLAEVQARAARTQAELEEKRGEAEGLRARLAQEEVEQTRLREQISSIEALLEAGQTRQAQEDKAVIAAEMEAVQKSLKEKEHQVASLEQDLERLKGELEQARKVIVVSLLL